MSRRGREWGLFALLVTPNLALLAAFTYWPLVFNLYLSLTEWNMLAPDKTFVGFENYRDLAGDPTFWRIFGNTFYFVGGGVLATLAIALAAALLLNQKLYGRGFARGVAFAPTVLTGSAIAIVWIYVFDPNYGLMRVFLNGVGLVSPRWLTDPVFAMPAILIVYVWKNFGYAVTVYLAGLQSIPRELHEAATVDGAGEWDWGAQLLGAIAAGATIATVWEKFIDRFEAASGITRGAPGSELSAMVFGQYFPNPAIFGADPAVRALVTPFQAFLVEMFGTAVLAFIVFALTDQRNEAGPGVAMTPLFVGFTVAALISLFAPITQAGWNPARDLGPRLVSWVLGWGNIAIPGPDGGFWIYLAGPFVGAPVGATIYHLFNPEKELMSRPIRVLFLCVHNSARSQMAEGFLRQLGGDRFESRSAGSEPADAIRPLAVKVMAQHGIDISGQMPKMTYQFVGQPWDYVITTCDESRQACPIFPGETKRIHWRFDDPSAAPGSDDEKERVFRRVAGEIERRVREFIESV
ncbi:MAG: ABC transporter permease subunit [Chloroflexota bacterium]|nr:MAG: ABC transporter permease subunit [Chloroflexota bacterium]